MPIRVKKKKKKERKQTNLWDNIKCTNFQIIGVPEEKRERKKKI